MDGWIEGCMEGYMEGWMDGRSISVMISTSSRWKLLYFKGNQEDEASRLMTTAEAKLRIELYTKPKTPSAVHLRQDRQWAVCSLLTNALVLIGKRCRNMQQVCVWGGGCCFNDVVGAVWNNQVYSVLLKINNNRKMIKGNLSSKQREIFFSLVKSDF